MTNILKSNPEALEIARSLNDYARLERNAERKISSGDHDSALDYSERAIDALTHARDLCNALGAR